MTPWGFLTCWFFGSLTSFNPLFIQGNAMLLPFSLAISHACSKLSGLCLWFQQWWHIIPVLKDGIFHCKKQQTTNRGNVARAQAPQRSISKCATKQPSVWLGKKKSDNGVIVLPPQAMLLFLTPQWALLATGRHRLGLPQVAGNPKGKGERTCCFSGDQDPTTGLQPLRPFLRNKQKDEQGSYSPCLIGPRRTQSQQHRSAFLPFVQLRVCYSRKTTKVCQESAIS